VPVDNSPYKGSTSEAAFITFGAPHVLDLLARTASAALKAAWYQKYYVHRRLRPEEFAGRVHNLKSSKADYPIHSELLQSPVLDKMFRENGSYLLPQSYPEGAPAHPAYPAGHAAIAGACTTMLKAFFQESFVVPGAVIAPALSTRGAIATRDLMRT
jgi:membrane-associated phospholipid phosphatase